MKGDQGRAASEALHACLRLTRSHVEAAPGIRTGVVIALVFLLGLPSYINVSTSIAVGVLFVAIQDTNEAPRVRLRIMLWGTLWTALAVLIGGMVGTAAFVHIGLAFILAGLCGYAGALGMRSGLTGVLFLVLFAFYAGFDIGVDVAVVDAGLFIIGGLLTIAVNLAMTPLRRLPSVRTGIARSFREIDQASRRRGLELAAPTIAAEILAARTVADHQGCIGTTAAWVADLLRDAERARLGLIALLAEESVSTEYVDELAAAAGRLAEAIAQEIEGPLGIPGRRRRHRPEERSRQLDTLVAAAPDERLSILAEELAGPLRAAAERLRGTWPIGPRAEVRTVHPERTPIVPRLRAHAHWGDAVVEHALRLVIGFGGATIFAVAIGDPHAYWVPLTVAWIAKPDWSSTIYRVTMRIVGTIIGLLLVTTLLFVVHDMPGRDVIIAVGIGAAGALALAFLWANYPVAVTGITGFVLLLEAFDSTTLERNIIARLLATVGAGLWVLLVSSVRPRRAGAPTIAALQATLAALRGYLSAVRQRGDVEAARARVLKERTAALAAVSANVSEPRGIWERPGTRIDPDEAAAVLTDIIDSASLLLAEELLERHGTDDPTLWRRVEADLDDIEARIGRLDLAQPAGRGSVA